MDFQYLSRRLGGEAARGCASCGPVRLENPRHIEFQILADKYGNTVHLGERECSIQRRHQKLIEESPSVLLDEGLRTTMGDMAVKAARASNYENAGTVEFLVDKHRQFYFLEMNTRLQVEHPVTEMRTGFDLVALQMAIAMGEPLPVTQNEIRARGHAIECRICAEDPWNSFTPSTGTITYLRAPMGNGVREDRGIEQGGEVTVFYDSMISKLVCWGMTRREAVSRMVRALREYILLGVATNVPLHLFVLENREFLDGTFDTHFIERHFRREDIPAVTEQEH
jgi:acetyl/propionyl-CoA carboxylase alpha subunit